MTYRERGYSAGRKDCFQGVYTGGMGSGIADSNDRAAYMDGYEAGWTNLDGLTQGRVLDRLRVDGWSMDFQSFLLTRNGQRIIICADGKVIGPIDNKNLSLAE